GRLRAADGRTWQASQDGVPVRSIAIRSRRKCVTARASEMACSVAQKKNGAPMRQSPLGRSETTVSRDAPYAGAITAIRLFSPPTAPSAWPWLRGSAALEMMLCIEADTVAPSRLTKMIANIIQPSVAAPQKRYARVDDKSPSTARRFGLNSLSNLASSRPCTSADTMPTAASDQPFSCGPQPNLKVVYRTQVV